MKSSAPQLDTGTADSQECRRVLGTAAVPAGRHGRLDRVLTTTCAPELFAPTAPPELHGVSGCSERATCCCRYSAAAARLERCSPDVISADSILLLPGSGRAPTLPSWETRLPALRETGDSTAAPAFVAGDGLDTVAEEHTAGDGSGSVAGEHMTGDGLDSVAEEQGPQSRRQSGRVEVPGGCW